MLGRSTTAIPRGATATEFIEPTQGYDAHQCAVKPKNGIPVQTQFDRSQVYIQSGVSTVSDGGLFIIICFGDILLKYTESKFPFSRKQTILISRICCMVWLSSVLGISL